MKYSMKININRLMVKLLMFFIIVCFILGSREMMNESVLLFSILYFVFVLMIFVNFLIGVMMVWGFRLIFCNLLISIYIISEMGIRKYRMVFFVISSVVKFCFICVLR